MARQRPVKCSWVFLLLWGLAEGLPTPSAAPTSRGNDDDDDDDESWTLLQDILAGSVVRGVIAATIQPPATTRG